MLTFKNLTEAQRLQLKQALLAEREEAPSYGEIAAADDLISDEELEAVYGATVFSPDDFF